MDENYWKKLAEDWIKSQASQQNHFTDSSKNITNYEAVEMELEEKESPPEHPSTFPSLIQPQQFLQHQTNFAVKSYQKNFLAHHIQQPLVTCPEPPKISTSFCNADADDHINTVEMEMDSENDDSNSNSNSSANMDLQRQRQKKLPNWLKEGLEKIKREKELEEARIQDKIEQKREEEIRKKIMEEVLKEIEMEPKVSYKSKYVRS